MLRYRVSSNVYTDVRDDEGQSLLDSALEGLGYEDGCLDVALYLMSRGCSDEDKTKLLCRACECGKLGAVKEMVEKYKVDPKSECDDNYVYQPILYIGRVSYRILK